MMYKLNYFLFGIFVAFLLSMVFDKGVLILFLIFLFIYFIVVVSLYYKKRGKKSLSKDEARVEKIKLSAKKEEEKKHEFIESQVSYIAKVWDLSDSQKRVFENFIQKRAYSDLYSKMTSSLLPQLTKMINICIEQEKKGCKREIQSRINRLVKVMKDEISKKRVKKKENFETLKDVYDHLLKEVEIKI